MKLNPAKGNMYDFITHTANAIKGECYHNCSYCYMKRWGKQSKVHLDEKELRTPMTEGNYIFVGSSCDMFANDIDSNWITKILYHCSNYDNDYLFQSKNPERFIGFIPEFPFKTALCTTIETNRYYGDFMKNSPHIIERAKAMEYIDIFDKYITIEPIMDFDLTEMIEIIKRCNPKQVNIGADSGNNHLPEPPKEKLLELIDELKKFTIINKKSNLGRLLK